MKLILPFLPFILLLSHLSISQTHVNREWIDVTGNPDTLAWSSSVINSNNELIHVGNTQVAGQNVEMLITKYDSTGTVIWQETFSHDSLYHDFSVAVGVDSSDHIYVAGTSKHVFSGKAIITVVKYHTNGIFLWDENCFSGGTNEDYTTDIVVSDDGDVFISGSSKSDTSDFDFLALKYNSSGVLQWDSRYDYNNDVDFSVKIEITDGAAHLSGASAISPVRWDFTTVSFNRWTGLFMSESRDSLSGLGYDVPMDFTRDELGNYYLTGRSSVDGINYDLRIIKLDSLFNQVWSNTVDFAGKKDEGLSIDVDTAGNVYVGGYVTRSNNIEELYIAKYNDSGVVQWEFQRPGDDAMKNARIVAVNLNDKGDLYYLGQESKKNGNIRSILGKFSADGKTIYQRYTETYADKDEYPTTLRLDSENKPYFTAIIDSAGYYNYVIRKYSEFTQNTDYEINQDSVPLFRSKELIVRFKQAALKDSMFYKEYQGKKIEFDSLHNFLTRQAMSRIDDALKNYYVKWNRRTPNPAGIMAVKMFKQLNPDYTQTLNRNGDTIHVPDFWTTLLISLPETLDIHQVRDKLNTSSSLDIFIAYAEHNIFIQPTSLLLSGVDDEHFNDNDQISLYDPFNIYNIENPDDPADITRNASIQIKDAWEIYPEAGKPSIKCGVVDFFIDIYHPDFGFDPLFPANSSKIRGIYDYFSPSPVILNAGNTKHGTEVAGIIGALRNNNAEGVAGIAGGNNSINAQPSSSTYFDDKGVSLYSLNIFDGSSPDIPDPIQSTYSAIVMSSIEDTSIINAFGVHLLNNSWSTSSPTADTNVLLLIEAMHFANRAQVSFIASRGNGNSSKIYPSCMDDDWVINVGGTGITGQYPNAGSNAQKPQVGNEIDVSAPSLSQLIFTTLSTYDPIPGAPYSSFDQTSAAAPHVTGVASLLLSYLNGQVQPAASNLAPKDVEQILELTADNYGSPGSYSDSIGWGKMNAGAAFHLIDTAYNSVYHFGATNTSAHFLTNTSIFIREPYQNELSQWFQKGWHDVNVYRIDGTNLHSIEAQDSVVAYWERPSSSDVFENYFNDTLLPRPRVVLDYLDKDSCHLYGFIYEVLDGVGNSLGWIPNDTTGLNNQGIRLHYSMISRDTTAPVLNLEEIEHASSIHLFPNPSSESHTLQLIGYENQKAVIDMYDIQGRMVKHVFDGKLNANEELMVDLSQLGAGMYLYTISTPAEQTSIKFIKE